MDSDEHERDQASARHAPAQPVSGADDFVGADLAQELYDRIGEHAHADLVDGLELLLARLGHHLAPLPGTAPAAAVRDDDLADTEPAQRQDILDQIHRTRLLVATLTAVAATSIRDRAGTAAWLGVDPALLRSPGQSRFEREQVSFLHAQRSWLGRHRAQLQDLVRDLLAHRAEFRPVPGEHEATVDDRFDQLSRGQEIDVLRAATHHERRGAESLWKRLQQLPGTALPQLLEVAAPATPAAAELSERAQALLADYRLAADPARYFSDEPG